MARGQPDWGGTSAKDTVFRVGDLGELAVRLGSVDSYERGGDVMAIETFESGLAGVSTTSSGTGALVDLHTGAARNGLFSARCVGGSDGIRFAGVVKSMPIIDLSNFGFEASFALPAAVGNVSFYVQIFDGTNRRQYIARWDDVNNQLSYFDSSGGFVVIATGVSLYALATHFHAAKLVIDAVDGEYIRFRLDDTTYTLADIAAQVTVDATLPRIAALVYVTSRSGANDTIYVDDLILTQNEPA